MKKFTLRLGYQLRQEKMVENKIEMNWLRRLEAEVEKPKGMSFSTNANADQWVKEMGWDSIEAFESGESEWEI